MSAEVDNVRQFPDTANRPVIKLAGGKLHEYADAAEAVLADQVYSRAQSLVRIGRPAELPMESSKLRRDAEQAVIVPVTMEYLRRELTRRATVLKFRARDNTWCPIDCPADLANNILESGTSKHFAPLVAIARAPFFRSDLTLCESPGYDELSGVFYEPSASYPSVPKHPTFDDAAAALKDLLEPFEEFPFASESSRSVFAAHILTAVIRVALPTSPVFFYTAPQAATGKTLLAKMPNLIATGTEPAARPFSEESEELRKVLYASLLAGDAALLLDNLINGSKVRATGLCSFTTSATYADRKLGVSEIVPVPNYCTVILTGNNLTPVGDIARRSLVVRLDSNAESARGRRFRIANLVRYVAEHRPSLLVAALTIVRAYIVAGMPLKQRALDSFEDWTRLACDPLCWLGMDNPIDSQQVETDDETDSLRAAFDSLHQRFPETDFTARKIAGVFGPDGEDLHAALELAGCADAKSAAKVGYWLRASRDKVAGGLKLVAKSGHAGIATWRLQPV